MEHEIYHDLTPFERKKLRDRYKEFQNNKCFFCQQDLDSPPPLTVTSKKINWSLFPPRFLQHPVHLQHDHKTGLSEGAVHAYCNAVMWQYHGR